MAIEKQDHGVEEKSGLTRAPLFSPAVVPAHRGMVTEVPLPLAAMPGAGTPVTSADGNML